MFHVFYSCSLNLSIHIHISIPKTKLKPSVCQAYYSPSQVRMGIELRCSVERILLRVISVPDWITVVTVKSQSKISSNQI